MEDNSGNSFNADLKNQNPDSVDTNPYQPPAAHLEDAAPASQRLADRGTRLIAVIVDVLIFLPLGILGGLTAYFTVSLKQRATDTFPIPLAIFFVLLGLGFLALLILNLVWLHRYGQSIGKRICKIKIVRTNGDRAALSRIILLRWLPLALLGAIPYLGNIVGIADALFIFRESRQCLHDQIADTIVVNI